MFIWLHNNVLLLSPLHITFHPPLYRLCFTIAFGKFPFANLVTFGEKEKKENGSVFLKSITHYYIKI